MLTEMISRYIPLLRNKDLLFVADTRNLPHGCELFWKVLNRGSEAERRDEIRGQIVRDEGSGEKRERTSFAGDHLVECYAVHRGIVVARGGTIVPINWREAEAA
jgi:Adenylyl/Guanylyl and SMODS C-terminal sensor domain